MRQELQNIEYIERYLENSLNKEDKRKFEQHLKEDAQFRAAVHLQRQLVQQIQEEGFLQDIAQQHTTFISEEKQSKKQPQWLLSMGITFLLGALILGAWWYYQVTPQQAPTPTAKPIVEEVPIVPMNEWGQAPEQLLPALQTPYIIKELSAYKSNTLTFAGTASCLTIPAQALVDSTGKIVTGRYELHYRPLNTPLAMLTTGFPLLTTGDNAQGIASVGAFEIRAFQKGQALSIAPNKKLSLDYELKKRVSKPTLYLLDEEHKTWEKSKQTLSLPPKGAYDEVVDSAAFKEAKRLYKASLQAANPAAPKRRGDTLDAGTITMMPKRLEKLSNTTPPHPNQYLIKHFKNPKLVQGLKLGSFGVYNCGKPYQVKNQVIIAGQYTDLERILIKNARTLSVIDMDFKAAYSFQPDQFICNSQANNVFLLWTKKGELYTFVKKAAVPLQTGTYSFQMENLSEHIQTSKDLQVYLERLANKVQ